MLLDLAILALGVVILGIGADTFVRGSSAIAERFGISPFVIGLVIVGFGTSSPELAVNLSAALKGSTDIAVGNVVGSNIANVALILGCAALVTPLLVQLRMVRLELPIMIAISVGLWALATDGVISRVEGGIMVAAFVAFLLMLFRTSKEEPYEVKAEFAEETKHVRSIWMTGVFLGGGLAMLIGGGWLCVDAAVGLARSLGVSELVIGLTIVAVGTSLPELASSVAAAWRGHTDIAIGNVIGSNIYNVLCVLGITATIQPLPSTGATLIWLDLPVMVGFAVVLVPMMMIARRVSRASGALLLAGYAAYLWYLVEYSRGVAAVAGVGG
jgi:cation:H+ antiporter